MSINVKDTQSILELTSIAAKAITKEATDDIFSRINRINEKQIDRLNAAVEQMSKLNATLAVTTERVNALSEKVQNMATEDYAEIVAQRVVGECADAHKIDARAKSGLVTSKTSMVIAFVALLATAADKVHAWFMTP